MDSKNYVLSMIKKESKHYFDDLDGSSTTDSIIKRLESVKEWADQTIKVLDAVCIAKGLNIMAEDEGIELKF